MIERTSTQTAKSVRGALEAWQFGRDHALSNWYKSDPIHVLERGREIVFRLVLGQLADEVMTKAGGEDADDSAVLAAAKRATKDLERKLIGAQFFTERSNNLFKRATAELKTIAAAEFVRRMRRVIKGEEDPID